MMSQRLTLRRKRFAELREQQSGVAFTEFALALPFLTMTLLGGLELVHLMLTHQQISQIATSTADLTARFQSSIDETDIETLFTGAQLSMSLDDFNENGRIILSSITRNPDDTGNWVRWQRCRGQLDVESEIGIQDDGRNDSSLSNTIVGMNISSGNNLMFAEVSYSYTPWFLPSDSSFLSKLSPVFSEREITYRSAFIARELALNDITNTTNMNVPDNCPATANPGGGAGAGGGGGGGGSGPDPDPDPYIDPDPGSGNGKKKGGTGGKNGWKGF